LPSGLGEVHLNIGGVIMKYVLEVTDKKIIGSPNVIIEASDEYATFVVVKLSGGQALKIGIDPDYKGQPKVYVNL
jgi:hypothetical protein